MTVRLVVLAIVDVAMLVACAVAGGGTGWALAVHALSGMLGYGIWLRGGRARGFAPAILGVLGPVGILAALSFGHRSGVPDNGDHDAAFGERPVPAAQRGAGLAVARMLDGRVRHAEPDALGSLVTIMRHGDVAARRRALETVVRSFEPALSPLIALALTDDDQTIRALAAAASARVAQNLALARAGLATSMADGSDPDAAGRLAALLADHARADVLLSDSQRAHLREDAVAIAPAGDGARDAVRIEALWAAGDYAAIDELAAAMAAAPPGDTAPMTAWWRQASAA